MHVMCACVQSGKTGVPSQSNDNNAGYVLIAATEDMYDPDLKWNETHTHTHTHTQLSPLICFVCSQAA